MRYFIILYFFLSFDLKAQTVHRIECDSISYDNQANKNYIEIKQDDFCQSAFVIQDICFYQNRFIEKANQGVIQYHPAYLLTKDDVFKVEKYLYEQLKLGHKGLTKKEAKSLQKNYHRQYVAFTNPQNEIEINVFFCSKKFLSEHLSFKYLYLSPLIISSANESIYSSKVTVSMDFVQFKNLVFRKVS